MKNKTVSLIIAGVTGFITLVGLILSLFVLDKWTIFWITLGVSVLTWLIFGIVIFVRINSTIDTQKKKTDIKDAIEREKQEILKDRDNPDNLILKKNITYNLGSEGHEKSPIFCAVFHGKEKNQKRVSIIDLNDVKNPTRLIDPTEKEIVEAMRYKAENPAPDPIKERILPFGYGTERTIPNPSRQRDEEELKKIEDKQAI